MPHADDPRHQGAPRSARSRPRARARVCGLGHGGWDEEGQAPPSAGPPGPWDDREVGEGEDVPYRPTDARGCRLGTTRSAGPGSVLGVWVVGTPCRTGTRVVRRYQRCLNSERGRKGGCYGRADRRCVRPVFLGRCWLHDRFYRRTVMGYRCTERRLYEVDGVYEGRVICRKGRRRISHSYTLLGKAPVAVDTESELRAAWGNPRVTAIDVTGRHLPARVRAAATRCASRRARCSWTAMATRCGRPASRSGCCARTGPGFVELRNVTLTRGGSDGPGGAVDDARRDHRHRLQDQAEPGRGAGRRDHVAAPRHDRPLGHHRQPGQRRRRRRVRAPRRHPGLRLDHQRQPRRRVRRRARLDRRHPRRALATSTATRPTATAARSTPTRTATSR